MASKQIEINKLRREVEPDRLFAAMLAVLGHRHRQAGGGEVGEVLELPELSEVDEEAMLTDFLKTCSLRQLRLLRNIAEGLEKAREQ
jgi:hypothetical protein